jgi:hypothetical protein
MEKPDMSVSFTEIAALPDVVMSVDEPRFKSVYDCADSAGHDRFMVNIEDNRGILLRTAYAATDGDYGETPNFLMVRLVETVDLYVSRWVLNEVDNASHLEVEFSELNPDGSTMYTWTANFVPEFRGVCPVSFTQSPGGATVHGWALLLRRICES